MFIRPNHIARWIALVSVAAVISCAPGIAYGQDSTAAPVVNDVRVCAGGDVTLGTNLDTTWTASAFRRYGVMLHAFPDPDSLLRPLRDITPDADILLLNVEGAIGEEPVTSSKCAAGSTNCFAFRQSAGTAAALRRLAGDRQLVTNVANNHSRDAGTPGFRETTKWLRQAGAFVTGADTLATPVVTTAGDTVAFLGFHTSRDLPDARDLRSVRRHVRRAAARWSHVVVTTHIGAEGVGAQRTFDQTEMFLGSDRGNPVAFARAAILAGADVVFAHGPHVLRAAEWRDNSLIFYSLGNLLTYGPFRITEPLNRGAIACVTLTGANGVADATLTPTLQVLPGHLTLDPVRRGLRLIDSLSRMDFPMTGASVDSAGNVGRLSEKGAPAWSNTTRGRSIRLPH